MATFRTGAATWAIQQLEESEGTGGAEDVANSVWGSTFGGVVQPLLPFDYLLIRDWYNWIEKLTPFFGPFDTPVEFTVEDSVLLFIETSDSVFLDIKESVRTTAVQG